MICRSNITIYKIIKGWNSPFKNLKIMESQNYYNRNDNRKPDVTVLIACIIAAIVIITLFIV